MPARKIDVSKILIERPWTSTSEIVNWEDVDPSTVNRQLGNLYDQQLAGFRIVGRRGLAVPRWIYYSRGVRNLYPDPHTRGLGEQPDHTHSLVVPEHQAHVHVPWQLNRDGAGINLERLEQLECLYANGPGLFMGPGRQWHDRDSPPKITGVTLLRHANPAFASVKYSGGIQTAWLWLGKQLLLGDMTRKWKQLFDDLDTLNVAQLAQLNGNPINDHAALARPVGLSGFVMMAADEWVFREAVLRLPRQCPGELRRNILFLLLKPNSTEIERQLIYDGTVSRSVDRIADRYEYKSVGRPEILAPGKRTPRNPAHVNNDPLSTLAATRIIDFVAEFYGMRPRHLELILPDPGESLSGILNRLVDGEYLVERRGMYYLGPKGCLYVARRDQVSLDSIQRRVNNFMKEDHQRIGGKWRHTDAVNDVAVALKCVGIPVFAGWRKLLNLRNTQPNPDLIMLVMSRFGWEEHYIEVERTAVQRYQVIEKLIPWETAADEGEDLRVVFVCETKEAEMLFSAETGNLRLLTTTLEEVKKGALTGKQTVWRYKGRPNFLEK